MEGKMSPHRNKKGFTLIEVLIAMFLLVVALLGMASVTVMVIKGNSFSKTMTTATTLAKDKMEQLKNTSYGSLSSGGPETIQSIYRREWTVPDPDYSPPPNMKTIKVTVIWNWQNVDHYVTLRTIVAQ